MQPDMASCTLMRHKSFSEMDCGIAQALEAFGDWWSLLIIRDAFFGIRRFSDFQQNLGIAKNILTDRLQRLVDHGILDRVDAGESGPRFEYSLTEKGEALLPVLTAMREWSDAWVFGSGNEPIIITDRQSGQRIPKLKLVTDDGREVSRKDLRSMLGPGADEGMRKLFQIAGQRRIRNES